MRNAETANRQQGRLAEWNDDRGFGFIHADGGGSKVFFHISALSTRRRRPMVGSRLAYQVVIDDKGRLQADAVEFVDATKRRNGHPSVSIFSVVAGTVALAVVPYLAYVRFSHPNSTIEATIYKVFQARDALRDHPEFQCSPAKSSCSQMKSCAEAFFHQERCAVNVMDGDRDGIPCEQQWCN